MKNKINFKIKFLVFFISSNIIFSQDKGLDYYNNQQFEAARKYYESIILESHNNPEAQLGRGSSSFKLGDFDSAKNAFDESLRSSDNSIKSKALYNIGNILYKNDKSKEALAFYRKALELNPNDKEAKYNYELLKYKPDPPEEDQKNQDKKKEQQEKEQEQQQEKEQEQQQEQQVSEEEKSQDMKQAESILDALKQDEQVMQKKQIARSKSRKLAKDW